MSIDQTQRDELKKVLLDLIPPDGASIGNATLRERLKSETAKNGQTIEDEDYWFLRNLLIDEGVIETGKGRGGSVHRISAPESEPLPPPPRDEVGLYDPSHESVRKGYAPDNRIKRFITEITALQGRRSTGGKWTRPDITMIALRQFKFLPGKHLEVITFELKPNIDTAMEGVFEVAAHSAFSHRSYLAFPWQTDEQTPPLFDRIVEESKRFKVGIITFQNPGDWDTFFFDVPAPLNNPDPQRVDEFIQTQISEMCRDEIQEWLR